MSELELGAKTKLGSFRNQTETNAFLISSITIPVLSCPPQLTPYPVSDTATKYNIF